MSGDTRWGDVLPEDEPHGRSDGQTGDMGIPVSQRETGSGSSPDASPALPELPARVREALMPLRALHISHQYVEDCWYTCPKSVNEKGETECCDDEAIRAGICNCGADEQNTQFDVVLAALTLAIRKALGEKHASLQLAVDALLSMKARAETAERERDIAIKAGATDDEVWAKLEEQVKRTEKAEAVLAEVRVVAEQAGGEASTGETPAEVLPRNAVLVTAGRDKAAPDASPAPQTQPAPYLGRETLEAAARVADAEARTCLAMAAVNGGPDALAWAHREAAARSIATAIRAYNAELDAAGCQQLIELLERKGSATGTNIKAARDKGTQAARAPLRTKGEPT